MVRIFAASLAMAFVAVAALTAPAYAQTAAGVQVPDISVVLNIGKIRRDAMSVKSIREQIINYQNKIQGEIQKEQEALRLAQQELAKKQSLLAPEAFAEERRKFEQRVVEVQQLVQKRRQTLEQAQANAMVQVERALNEIVATMADKEGYGIILRFSQVVYVKTHLEITDQVLKELDQKLPTVQVDLPKN